MNMLFIVLAALTGAILGWLFCHFRALGLRQSVEQENAILRERLANRDQVLEEKMRLLANMSESFQASFKALSSDALKSNNQSFLDLATASLSKFQEGAKNELEKRERAIDELVKPLKESLQKVDTKIEAIEKTRTSSHASLSEQLKLLTDSQSNLRNETSNLVKALRTPHIRGRWGEIQLRRIVEMVGMVEYCDFLDQHTVSTEDGRLRPDLVVKLPNNRCVVVDSKVPLMSYSDSLSAADDVSRVDFLKDHARQLRSHLMQLGQKAYWEQYPGADFVVLFIPGETFFYAALEQDPSLIEFGVERGVLIATPTSLIGLLRVVAYGWKQEAMEENAKKISELGAELYDRTRSLAAHFLDLRKGLDRAVESYNKAAGSLERRVLVSARKFKELSTTSGEDIQYPESIEKTTRALEIEIVSEQGEGIDALSIVAANSENEATSSEE